MRHDAGCQRAQELFSDDLEGTLGVVLRGELAEHLRGCEDCRALRAAMEEVVAALRRKALVEPSAGLAARAGTAALEQARRSAARGPACRNGPARCGSPPQSRSSLPGRCS
jgi:predicted anti-sigma-YlaC factor YlaD